MKKILSLLFCSVVMTLMGTFINYRYYLGNRHLLWAKKTWGGECMNENGFGLNVFHTYGMTPDQPDTVSLRFDPVSFIITVLFITAILCLILFAIRKIKEGRSL